MDLAFCYSINFLVYSACQFQTLSLSLSISLSLFLFLFLFLSFTFLKSLTPCFTLQCLKSKAMEMTYSSNYMFFFFFFFFLTCLLHINFHPVVGYTTKKKITMIDDIFWVYWSDLKKKTRDY